MLSWNLYTVQKLISFVWGSEQSFAMIELEEGRVTETVGQIDPSEVTGSNNMTTEAYVV